MKKQHIKAWAVVMFDGFIPDFSIKGKIEDVHQIHSSRKAAEKVVAALNKDNPDAEAWQVKLCTITY